MNKPEQVLIDALKFYANEHYHNDDVWSCGTKLDDSTMEKDWGQRARQALEQYAKQKREWPLDNMQGDPGDEA